MKNEMNPLKNGKRTVLEIKVIDEDKAFDYIGKHILGKIDENETGFIIEKMYLSEDKYKENIKESIIKEIKEDIEVCGNQLIEKMIAKLSR